MAALPALRLVEEARKLVGVPFSPQGRSVHGVDCFGVVALAAKNAGSSFKDLTGVDDRRCYASPSQVIQILQWHWTPTKPDVPGSVILFRWPYDQLPSHFGLCVDQGNVIHANAITKKVVEHGLRGQWLRCVHSHWLLPGVAYAP